MKKILSALYIVVIAVMAIATIVEKEKGITFVAHHIYGSWWFTALWALLVAAGIAWIVKRKMKRWPVVLLHASFVVILVGALLTHLTSKQGFIHLRVGEIANRYELLAKPSGELADMQPYATKIEQLPFSIRLDAFRIIYHEGTETPADYESSVSVVEPGSKATSTASSKSGQHIVSMNNIFSHRFYRFYQSSYDDDFQGSILAVNSDPYGIAVTYLGYALLFFSLLYMLIDPRGTFRRLLRSPLLKGVLVLATLIPTSALAAPERQVPTVPRAEADIFGQLLMLYNGRICPVQTFAIDFTKKLYGKSHYGDYSAEQVLLGFIFWGDEWSKEPIVKVKSGALKSQLDLPTHCSINTFFNEAMGGYTIGPYVEEYLHGQRDAFHKQAAQIDEKIKLVMDLRTGMPLKLFPIKKATTQKEPSQIVWLPPTGKMPEGMTEGAKKIVGETFVQLYQDALSANFAHFASIIDATSRFQQENAGSAIPSASRLKAEHIYNRIPFATILFMLNLTMGFVSLFFIIASMRGRKDERNGSNTTNNITFRSTPFLAILVLSFLALSVCIGLRWTVKGSIPMGNGYETMLLTAWFAMGLSLLMHFRLPRTSVIASLVLTFGFLVSGFFLLVSHISLMDPQITHMMPVLNSPLLTLHVSIIMMAYALVSLTFICSVAGVASRKLSEPLAVLSRIFLFPAITCMGLGIFIGAIWANVSWGTYWSWDPKETWALITFMVYAIALHTQSIGALRNPRVYHIFMLLAFLTLLMTYFGVNYFLGGMHSYA